MGTLLGTGPRLKLSGDSVASAMGRSSEEYYSVLVDVTKDVGEGGDVVKVAALVGVLTFLRLERG